MRKFTAMLVSLLAVFSVTTEARADLIVEPPVSSPSGGTGPSLMVDPSTYALSSGISPVWIVILVIIVVVVAAVLLRMFRKK